MSKMQSEVISSLFSPLQEMYLIQTKEIKSSVAVLELKLLCTYVQERLLPPWSIQSHLKNHDPSATHVLFQQ